MKNSTDIKKVAIIGAGTMGLGIAQVFAQKGYATFLFDLNEAILEKAKSIIEKNLTKAVESKIKQLHFLNSASQQIFQN